MGKNSAPLSYTNAALAESLMMAESANRKAQVVQERLIYMCLENTDLCDAALREQYPIMQQLALVVSDYISETMQEIERANKIAEEVQ